MKIVPWLFVLIALVFTGCATNSNVPESAEDLKPEPVEEVIKEPVKIITMFYYPLKIESYFGDGVKDEYTVYNYAEGMLIEELLFSADGSNQQSVKYDYKSSDSHIKRTYDITGDLVSYDVNTMDSDGNLLKREKYNNKDMLQSISEYEYFDGMKSSWKVYTESGGLLSTTVYKYSDNLLSRIDSLSPGGELEEFFELNYDDNGLLIENIHNNSEGEIQDSRSYEYNEGFLVLELINRKNGSVLRKILYNNDDNGNAVETIYMDAGDNVQERLVTVYDSREEISYEK
jgi:hypothetical protein